MIDGIEFIDGLLSTKKSKAARRLLCHWRKLWSTHREMPYRDFRADYFDGRGKPSSRPLVTVLLSGFANPERNGTYLAFPSGDNTLTIGSLVTLNGDGTVRASDGRSPIIGVII